MITNTNLCTIYLFRHGLTEWNVQGRMQGHADSPLTPEGIAGIRQRAEELKEIEFAAIYASDLGRTVQTAEILKLERQLAIMTKQALRERSFGQHEGSITTEYKEKFKDLYQKFYAASREEKLKFKFTEDYESDEEVAGRFITVLREIAIAHPNQHVLVVSHGATLRNFLSHLDYDHYGNLPSGSIKNGAYIKFDSDGVDFFIREVHGVSVKKQ